MFSIIVEAAARLKKNTRKVEVTPRIGTKHGSKPPP
jgi:hypothetical protein